MNRSITFLAVLLPLLFIAGISHGQLSDRVNSPSTIKYGTRPIAGDMGISFGASFQDIESIFSDDIDYETTPIVNFKFYTTDKFVVLAGVKFDQTKRIISGNIDPVVDGNGLKASESKSVETNFMLALGFERHFLSSNILDIYVGARVPVGNVRDYEQAKQTAENDDFIEQIESRNSLVYGMQGFVGMQAFIADMPVAVGLQVGINGFGYIGKKTKHEYEENVGGEVTKQTWYVALDDDTYKFSSLKARSFEAGPDFRVELAWYFSR